MYGLKSHSYDMIIDVIPLEKQFELLELYDTIEDYMLLAQITGIDSLHIKLILHRRRIILNRRKRNAGKYMAAADLILLEWIKYNIRTEKDISKSKIYKQVEDLKALLDIPCYHVRKQTWLQINSIICDNLKIPVTKENHNLNIYGILKTCGEYILEPNAYRKFMYSVEQNTFFRVKEKVKKTEFDKTNQSVLSKAIETKDYNIKTPEKIVDQSITTTNLNSIEKPVFHMDASHGDNDDAGKSFSSSKLNDESIKKSCSSLEESKVRGPVKSLDLNLDVTNGNSGNKTERKSDSSFNLNDKSMDKSSLSIEESGACFERSPDVSLIEKPVIEVDIIDEDGVDGDSSYELNDDTSIKESSLALKESEEHVLASPDLILIENPIVQIDISNDGDENNKEMKSNLKDKFKVEPITESSPSLADTRENKKLKKSNLKDKFNAELITRSSPSLAHMQECVSTSPDLILIEKPIVQIDITNDDNENDKEMKSNSKDKLNEEMAKSKKHVLIPPELILIEKAVMPIDITNDDEENNLEIKSNSKNKFNAEYITRSSPSLVQMQERVSTTPDLILIEKPIVQIDISNDDDDESNTANKSTSKEKLNEEMEESKKHVLTSPDLILIEKPIVQIDITNDDDDGSNTGNKSASKDIMAMERNPKILKIKSGKRHLHSVDFEDFNPVRIKKERKNQNYFKDIPDIAKSNNECQLNVTALDVFNKPIVDMKPNLQLSYKETKTTTFAKENNGLNNFKVSHPGPIDTVPEGLDNFEEFLDISQPNDDFQLNGSALDIINTSAVDIKQEFKNCGQNFQLQGKVTKTKSAKGNVERVKYNVSHSMPVNKKAEELNNLEAGLHIAKHNNNRPLNGSSSNNFNTPFVDTQEENFRRLEQNSIELTEFSTTNPETQRDEILIQETKPKCPMDCISQTDKKEYNNEIPEENVKSNEVLDRIENLQEIKSIEMQNNDNNIDNHENDNEDDIEIEIEIEDDDGNVQFELLEISELVAKQLMEKQTKENL